jgi:hypothetical protein
MRKLFLLFCIIALTNVSPLFGNFYICRETDDCAMYVIEDSAGYSWHIECMDGSTATGRTDGGSYGGNCELMVI